jgi:nucleoid-associated protein YgaU
MTRENKLVMVIGFGLLLFVGILVSDHLSARESQIATPMTKVSYEPTKQLPTPQEERVVDFGRVPERGQDDVARVGDKPLVEDSRMLPRVETTTIPVPPASQERTHTVAKGENPEKIAQKYYGKRTLAAKLAEYNGIDPTKLRIGQTLKIPDLAVLDPSALPKQPEMFTDAVVQPPAPQSEGAIARPAEPRFRTVTVQKGDTAWKIAERAYGNGSKWKQLSQLNPGFQPNALKVGAVLKVAAAE